MIKNSSRFLLNTIFGVLIGLAILIAAEQLGFWKKNWQAEHTIINYPSFHLAERFMVAPRYPAPIVQIALAPLEDSQKITKMYLLDRSPILDKTQLSVHALRLLQADFSRKITFTVFEEKLEGTKSVYPPCPPERTDFWTDCFGTYKFPWGEIYSGVWGEDKLNGVGKLIKENGDIYIGGFLNNQYNGCGLLFKTVSTIQSGIWQYGQLVEETNRCNASKTD